MEFENACLHYPISKILINNIGSMQDFDNLIQSSNQIKNSMINNCVRKTFNIPKNTLFFEHECLEKNEVTTWNDLSIFYEGSKYTLSMLYQYLNSIEKKNFEHIHTISVRFSDDYSNYENNRRHFFSQLYADFIDKIFDKCYNATTLELINIKEIQFYIIKYLKSPRIQVITKLNFNELIEYCKENQEVSQDIITQLPSLREINFFIKNLARYEINSHSQVLQKIFQHLTSSKYGKINFYGVLEPKNSEKFREILMITENNNIEISLNGSFICNNQFFDLVSCQNSFPIYPVKNVVSLSVSLYDKSIFQSFLKSLPYFTNLTELKIELRDQLFENIINDNTLNIFSEYVDLAAIQKMSHIQSFFLEIQNSSDMYEIESNYEKSLDIKSQLAKDFCLSLGENLQTLYLNGIPKLTNDVSEFLSTNCSKLENIYLSILEPVSTNFLEKMETLKVINLKGFYKLNVPRNVKMFIIQPKNDSFSNEIGKLSNDSLHHFLNNFYGKYFKHSLRNICNTYMKYIVVFDNIFDWSNYIKHLDMFENAF
uniref:F-box domain-containing protein n=1 Tax=Strongyloides venezuelensis TaxID=75913 RepID=A0A0K0G365_STRVS